MPMTGHGSISSCQVITRAVSLALLTVVYWLAKAVAEEKTVRYRLSVTNGCDILSFIDQGSVVVYSCADTRHNTQIAFIVVNGLSSNRDASVSCCL
mmetsp:Transcript_18237/g.38089  ORF Transcript_18237/g.38089 Transcript_18237/m.38089 type:complete len:96 (+) Transcript_18237:106-393(+)